MLNPTKSLSRIGVTAVFAAASLFGMAAQATDITGAGSSFVYPVLSKWSAGYAEKTGNKLNYQSVGSGAGIAQIKEGTIDFGASDAPLKAEDLAQFGLGQFPVVVGGIVPVVNIAGIEAGQIKLDGTTLADIFLGKITNWNDPAHRRAERRPEPADRQDHRRASLGRFGHHLQLHQLPVQGQPGLGEQGQVRYGRRVADRRGRQGQRRRVGSTSSRSRDSIGYVEYAYALQEQDQLRST